MNVSSMSIVEPHSAEWKAVFVPVFVPVFVAALTVVLTAVPMADFWGHPTHCHPHQVCWWVD